MTVSSSSDPDPNPDPVAICRAAQLVPLSPPVYFRGGWEVYVVKRPGEATLRRRLKDAGAVLIRYGVDHTFSPAREYVRFLIDDVAEINAEGA